MPDVGPLAPLTLLNALGGLRFSRALSRLSLFLYGFYKTGKWPAFVFFDGLASLIYGLRTIEKVAYLAPTPRGPHLFFLLRAVIRFTTIFELFFYIFFAFLVSFLVPIVPVIRSGLETLLRLGHDKVRGVWYSIKDLTPVVSALSWLGEIIKEVEPITTGIGVELDVFIAEKMAEAGPLLGVIEEVCVLANSKNEDLLENLIPLFKLVLALLKKKIEALGGLEAIVEDRWSRWRAFKDNVGGADEILVWLYWRHKEFLGDFSWELFDISVEVYNERKGGRPEAPLGGGGLENFRKVAKWLKVLWWPFGIIFRKAKYLAKKKALNLAGSAKEWVHELAKSIFALAKTALENIKALFNKGWAYLTRVAKILVESIHLNYRGYKITNSIKKANTSSRGLGPEIENLISIREAHFEALSRGFSLHQGKKLPSEPPASLALGGASRSLILNLVWKYTLFGVGIRRAGTFLFICFSILFRYLHLWGLRQPIILFGKKLPWSGHTTNSWGQKMATTHPYGYEVTPHPISLIFDLPLVGVPNIRGILFKKVPPIGDIRRELSRVAAQVRFALLAVGALSILCKISIKNPKTFSQGFPPGGLVGQAHEVLHRIKRGAKGKATLWRWEFRNGGSHIGGSYWHHSLYHNLSTSPSYILPGWASPLRSRYASYESPSPFKGSWLRVSWALLKDSLFRPPRTLTHRKWENSRRPLDFMGSESFKFNEAQDNFRHYLTTRYYRPPFPGVKPIKIGDPLRVGSPVPLTEVKIKKVPGRLSRTWSNLKKTPSFLLWKNLSLSAPTPQGRFWTKSLFKKVSLNLASFRRAWEANQRIYFSPYKYFSYFFYKTTHPCGSLPVAPTRLFHPPHWGLLRSPISFVNFFKYGFLVARFAIVGYRFKTRILPLLKSHLWLHYFYPIAGAMGLYPSLLEPGQHAFNLEGGVSFCVIAYRLARSLKKALTMSFRRGSTGNEDLEEAVNEIARLTLNSRPSMGLSQGYGLSHNYGFGGYWGHEQTFGLVDLISSIRPLFRGVEFQNFLRYKTNLTYPFNPFNPFPRAPLNPPLEFYIHRIIDTLSPRGDSKIKPRGPARPSILRNPKVEAEAEFLRAYKASPGHPLRWEESIRGSTGPLSGGPRRNQVTNPSSMGLKDRVDQLFSPNLRWGNSLAHRHGGSPYLASKRSSFPKYPEEAVLFRGGGLPRAPQEIPAPRLKRIQRTSALYDRYSNSPTNGFLLKERKRRGGVLHYESHPSLGGHWSKSGVWSKSGIWGGDLPLGAHQVGSRPFGFPTYPNHEFKSAVFELADFFKNFAWALGRTLGETFYSWAAGPEYGATLLRLVLLPVNILGIIMDVMVEGSRVDLLPNISFTMDRLDLGVLINPQTYDKSADISLSLAFVVTLFSVFSFLLDLTSKFIKIVFWCLTNPSAGFWFGWGGVGKIGDFMLPPLEAIPSPRVGPPSGLLGSPPKITLKGPESLIFWPLLRIFCEVEIVPKPFTSSALCLGRGDSLVEEVPYYFLGCPGLGGGSGFFGTLKSVAESSLRVDYGSEAVKKQAWVVPVWILKLLLPGGPWDYFLYYDKDCLFNPEWREEDKNVISGFWSMDGVSLDELGNQVFLCSEVAPLALSLEDRESLGILNLGCGLILDWFVFPLLFPQEVALGRKRLPFYQDIAFGDKGLQGRSLILGDLLDWPTTAGKVGSALLVWIGRNWFPYDLLEPIGAGKPPLPKGKKGFPFDLFNNPLRKWWEGSPSDEATMARPQRKLVRAILSYWSSPISLILYHYPINLSYAKNLVLAVCTSIFTLVCFISPLSPFWSALLPSCGAFVVPQLPMQGYRFSSTLLTPKEAQAGVFNWIFFFLPRKSGWDSLYPNPTWGEYIYETPRRVDFLIFLFPFIRSTLTLFKEKWGGGLPHSRLDKGSRYTLTQLLDYKTLGEDRRCLRSEFQKDSSFFFWPDLFFSTEEASRGLVVDILGPVARGLVGLFHDVWLWPSEGSGIDLFAIPNDVDHGTAEYYYRQGPKWGDW